MILGRFYAKVPLGESRMDVCLRVKQFFGTIQRDATRHGITDLIIVSHGVTIRAFLMMWLHLTPGIVILLYYFQKQT